MNIEDLIKRSAFIFSKHDILLPLWQDIADNFYVERADFTHQRSLNEDFAAHLTSSYPLLVRRDFGDQISSLLRPKGEQWFKVSVDGTKGLSVDAKRKLEEMTGIQHRITYDRKSGFTRATKEADHDFSAFGNAVITPEVNWKEMCVQYRCWHLRDFAWIDDLNGRPCETHQKWKPTFYDLQTKFPGKLSAELMSKGRENPYMEVECRRVTMPSDQYLDRKEIKKKFVCVTFDLENRTVFEVTQKSTIGAVIPRWKTVSGSQYAYSPASVIALPDARLIQSMTLSMLEAGEMAVRPPLLAASDSIREDIQYFAGGITKADVDSDRQLRDVLAPIMQDKGGYQFGLELSRDTRDMIASAFYINKLTLPPSGGKEMTAYETGQRIQEYIRGALPLFEPLEDTYNGELCEQTFDMAMEVGAFGNVRDFPRDLQGRDVKFEFSNPLQEAMETKKVGKWREALALTAESMQIDPSLVGILKPAVGLRDALEGGGVPMNWISSEEEMEAAMLASEQAKAQAQQMAQMQQMAEVAEKAGKANKSFAEAS
jgi:hypothetical protein